MKVEKQMEEFLDACGKVLSSSDLESIKKVLIYAQEKYDGVKRLNGSPYFEHAIDVARILLDFGADVVTLTVAILHGVINNSGVSKEELEENFGSEVADLVDVISKLNRLELQDDSEHSALSLRKVLVGMSEDVRVLFLKLADRLQNLRTAMEISEEERKKMVQDTLAVLIPIGHRLGVSRITSEMEDLCLRYSKPDVYQDILERLNVSKEELKDSLSEMEQDLSEMLMEQSIPYRIKSRVKSVYSIYNKLNNGKKWENIYDILALRIIVETIPQCYLTIGLIHAKYRPIPGRFKDYIAIPKANMYQSLHTGVFGSDGHRYEIQVRTEEMDEFAEKGFAAHFAYKEKHNNNVKSVMEQKLESFRNLIESTDTLSDIEFEGTIQNDLLNESIYVFTPKGDVLELPKGSTPLDFAYRIHSAVGDSTVQALVNDVSVPLDYELHNNDIVKIRTNPSATPSKEWLNYCKTSHAKNKIKAYFSKQEKDIYTEKGKVILQNELRKRKLSYDTVFAPDNLKKILSDLKLEDLEDLYFSIGSLRYTASYIISLASEDKSEVVDLYMERLLASKPQNQKKNTTSDVLVGGEDHILVSLAKCCHPILGDEIKGYVTKGDGVSVHRSNCKNLFSSEARFIDVKWRPMSYTYLAKVKVTCESGKNYLMDLVGKATSKNVTIDSVKTKSDDSKTVYELMVKVASKDELDRFMDSLLQFKFVESVDRI
ncbi:MAG: bifunctional (p)ppGpp synthetase/guanosine-3',5'-bis(diphosphate) 3'-pyrophosphohydrolase [Bacilli bacterium]|nr:bifunctional (p)ppGpp synthetase/guanosine-3',5'-bis(diphosphate) 3'-pyrophosphohydrolase [Bacilli bacterium]